MRWFYAAAIGVLPTVQAATAGDVPADVVIPTTYEAGHFYATPTLSNGKTLRLLLDTGGGSGPTNWMNTVQARAVGLETCQRCTANGENMCLTQPVYKGEGLPKLGGECEGILSLDYGHDGKWAGQIVPSYFRRGVWTFDYPARRVVLHEGKFVAPKGARSTRLGLKKLDNDKKLGWPSIIDGRVSGDS